MNIGKAALSAIKWLGRAIGFLSANEAAVEAILNQLKASEKIKKVFRKFYEDLEEIESSVGAQTTAWDKIDTAFHAKTEVSLTVDEVVYMHYFADAFDKMRLKILKQAGTASPDEDEE